MIDSAHSTISAVVWQPQESCEESDSDTRENFIQYEAMIKSLEVRNEKPILRLGQTKRTRFFPSRLITQKKTNLRDGIDFLVNYLIKQRQENFFRRLSICISTVFPVFFLFRLRLEAELEFFCGGYSDVFAGC